MTLAAPTPQDLEAAFSKGQWDEAAEIAFEMLPRYLSNPLPRLKGAYALFQSGFSNSALILLKPVPPSQWKQFPQGEDRFVEIVSLFQKKVPLSMLPGRLEQASIEGASPFLRNEIHFAKGRAAFEKQQLTLAREHLTAISRGSRFYSQAHYLLGTMAVESGDYQTAAEQFSVIFDPTMLEQSSEFWNDINAQVTSHWGSNVKVVLDESLLEDASRVGELAVLALARLAYANKQFETAITRYEKISNRSTFYARAQLEKVWALLAQGRHRDAQKAAAQLSVDEAHFEAIEARTLHALILVDAGKTDESRQELDAFFKVYDATKGTLNSPINPPAFLGSDLKHDQRLQTLIKYESGLEGELQRLQSTDLRLFPVYSYLATELSPLMVQTKGLIAQLTQEHITHRIEDLDRLFVQAKLILAETYLEDREKLRKEFTEMANIDDSKQREHDERLVKLLSQAVEEVDKASAMARNRNLNLDFRQAELLWELSTAQIILSQSTKQHQDETLADSMRKRALAIAEDITAHHPNFPKRGQAMFFSGFAGLEMGNNEAGARTLETYVRQYPRHTHVPDAYRILADMKFDGNQFAAAELYYRKVLEFPDSPIVGYALYKIGWCNYNLKNYAKALLGMEQAILWASNADKTHQLLTLRREGRRDLISVYAEVGNHHKAFDYFQRVAGGELLGWISDLAEQLDKMGQYEKSSDLYKQLIAFSPTAGDTVGYQTSIIRGAFKLRHWQEVLGATRELVTRYKSQLESPQPEGQPAYYAEKVVREVALAWHFEVDKAGAAGLAELPALLQLDELYLSAFSKWDTAQEPLNQYAHGLLKSNRLADATGAFKKHWTTYQSNLKEPNREEALRNLIHSLEKVNDSIKADKDELPAPTKDLLSFSEAYEKLYPDNSHARAIAFLRTAILFKHGQTDAGITESQKLFDANPADDFGKRAFNNLRVAYYDRKDWEHTYQWATTLSARMDTSMAAYAQDLKTVREESLFLWADTTTDNGSSAAIFLKIARDPQFRRLRENSLYNAFIRYQKADNKVEALAAAEWLEKSSPTFKSLAEIAPVRAALYQEAGDYAHAFPLFQAFLAHPDKAAPEVVQQARLNAGLIAEALGQYDIARGTFKQYLGGTPKGTESGQAEAKRALERMSGATSVTAAPSRAKRGLASTPGRWDTLMMSSEDFQRQSLPRAGDLAARIKSGGERLEHLAKGFLELANAADTSDRYAFEAYCSLPFLYLAYSKAIIGLATGAPAEVRAELEKISGPLEAKSGDLADECLKKSSEASHDGTMYRKVLERWGWRKDAAQRKKVDDLLTDLQRQWPWLEPVPMPLPETQLVELHLRNQGTPDSWYSLGRVRWEAKKMGLGRLTLVDALAKDAHSGRILNSLACLESLFGDDRGAAELFKSAAKEGSAPAWANLAYFHLKGGRLVPAMEALQHASEGKVFDDKPELKALVEGLVKK